MQMNNVMKIKKGFTLLEVLVALFIFTIVSMMLMRALHTVIQTQSRTEESAERLSQLQVALLLISRDVGQAVNRPILTASGKEEGAFVGTPKGFVFTHMGFANPDAAIPQSAMQRTEYSWHESSLWRNTWPVLDQAPQTRAHSRLLLNDVRVVRFRYLDKDGRFQDNWPSENEQNNDPLPRAINISLTISNWGAIDQTYVIPAQTSNSTSQQAQSTPTSQS